MGKSKLSGLVLLLAVLLGVFHFCALITLTSTYHSHIVGWLIFHLGGLALCSVAAGVARRFDGVERQVAHYKALSAMGYALEKATEYGDMPYFPSGYSLVGKTIDPMKKYMFFREGKNGTLEADVNGVRVRIATELRLGQTIEAVWACRVKLAPPEPLTPDEAAATRAALDEVLLPKR